MNAPSKSCALRCAFRVLNAFSSSAKVSFAGSERHARYARARLSNRWTCRNVTASKDAFTRVRKVFELRSLFLLKCIFEAPQAYSIPCPANSGWHFGDITRMCPRLWTSYASNSMHMKCFVSLESVQALE